MLSLVPIRLRIALGNTINGIIHEEKSKSKESCQISRKLRRVSYRNLGEKSTVR